MAKCLTYQEKSKTPKSGLMSELASGEKTYTATKSGKLFFVIKIGSWDNNYEDLTFSDIFIKKHLNNLIFLDYSDYVCRKASNSWVCAANAPYKQPFVNTSYNNLLQTPTLCPNLITLIINYFFELCCVGAFCKRPIQTTFCKRFFNQINNNMNTLKLFSFLSIFLYGITACNKSGGDTPIEENQMPETPTEWVLDFQENFDGNALNTDNWAVYDNEYLEKEGKLKPENTRRTYAIEVKDGFLNCLIDKDPKRNGWFMTGGIAHKKNYKYGKFEFRIRMDEDPHKSSSGLGLTWPESEKWPDDGENDIYETAHENNTWNTNIHYAVSGKDQKVPTNFPLQQKRLAHRSNGMDILSTSRFTSITKLVWNLKDPYSNSQSSSPLVLPNRKRH